MLINRKRRLDYLGFNDTWFMIIGILVLSLVTDFLFSKSFFRFTLLEATVNWSVSLFFTICNWLILRAIMIGLRKKYPAFKDSGKRIIIFFVILVVTVVLVDIIGNEVLAAQLGDNYHPALRSKIILPIVLISTMTMAIYEAIYYYIRLKKSVQQEEEAKRIVVQAQLDALRNQAQPHFLFNSLNTLRDIIDQNSKEEAKVFVDKLADVYRFILESSNANLIPLRDELKFARAYIHIQSERFGDNLQLEWDIPMEATDTMIVPMSLQLLLENAIKHNVVSRAKPLLIRVMAQGDSLRVENAIQAKSTQLPSTKLGLKNIRQRYELISDREMQVSTVDNRFVVSLPLLKSIDQKKTHAAANY